MTVLSESLVELLVCPVDHQPLDYIASEGVLYNQRNRHRYEVRGAVPVLLASEATLADDDEHARLMRLINDGGSAKTGATANEEEGS